MSRFAHGDGVQPRRRPACRRPSAHPAQRQSTARRAASAASRPAVAAKPSGRAGPPRRPPSRRPTRLRLADEAKIAELRALAEKQEAAKRYNEFVRTLMQLAAIVPNVDERVDLYQRAADLYITKFANQAEAVKAYEAILEIEPRTPKRSTFCARCTRSAATGRSCSAAAREAERLPPGPERATRLLEIGQARHRARQEARRLHRSLARGHQSDAENVEALGNLAGLYERPRISTALASVLEKQSEVTFDARQRIQILGKLAAIYGDR